MTKPIHTPWFDGEHRPDRHGPYQRRRPRYDHVGNLPPKMVTRYHKFDGVQWYVGANSPEKAMRQTEPSAYQSLPWRGRLVQS